MVLIMSVFCIALWHFTSQLQYEINVLYSQNWILICKTGQLCWYWQAGSRVLLLHMLRGTQRTWISFRASEGNRFKSGSSQYVTTWKEQQVAPTWRMMGDSSRAIITHRARITFQLTRIHIWATNVSHDFGDATCWKPSIKCSHFTFLQSEMMNLACSGKPNFIPAAQRRTPFHYNGRNFSLHLIKNPKWFQQQRAPCSPRMPGHYW